MPSRHEADVPRAAVGHRGLIVGEAPPSQEAPTWSGRIAEWSFEQVDEELQPGHVRLGIDRAAVVPTATERQHVLGEVEEVVEDREAGGARLLLHGDASERTWPIDFGSELIPADLSRPQL